MSIQLNISNLLQDDTPGAENGERKRLHAARINSLHLRQPVGEKRMLQMAFEEIERLLDVVKVQDDSIEYLTGEIEYALRAGFFTRLWRRIF
jgi:hypothetical protein